MSLPKISTAAILLHIGSHGDDENYVTAMVKNTNYPSGTIVPMLRRLSERDELLTKREGPGRTGRARIIYSLTPAGQKKVNELKKLLKPRVKALAKADAPPELEKFKLNMSTLWLFSAALMNDGTIIGYSDDIRPLTHQAAYTELARLKPFGVFDSDDDGRHVLTRVGHGVAASEAAYWRPLV